MDTLLLIFIAAAWLSVALPMVLHFRTARRRHEELLAKLEAIEGSALDSSEWVTVKPHATD